MKYQHIVFDVDGTLIDTEQAVIQSLNKTLKEYCNIHQYNYEDLKFALGIPGRDALEKIGLEHIDEVLTVWNDNIACFLDQTQPFDGIEACLKELKHLGAKVGIVTSKTQYEYQTEFEIFGFSRLFDVVVCADDTDKHKPNPDPLLKYCQLARTNKENIIYVGDSIYDMQCSQRAGIDSALALWGCASSVKPKAKYYLENPMDILDLL